MKEIKIRLTLKSAATFGSGDGVAGLVDREIEQDADGFPYLRGKTLKGLLVEAAENVLYALKRQGQTDWEVHKENLFGQPGRGWDERGKCHIGDAKLPASLPLHLLQARKDDETLFSKERVLESLTAIRQQTAVNPNGAPDHASLRAMRVLLPGIVLESELSFDDELTEKEAMLLVASVLDLRRAGVGRNRGRGQVEADLLVDSEPATKQFFDEFVKAVS